MDLFRLVGPNRAVELFGVKLVGVHADNAKKLVFSILFVAVVVGAGRALQRLARHFLEKRRGERGFFWVRQSIRLFTTGVALVGLASVWFDDPTRLTTAVGLVTAGLAFALQKVITAVAGYFVILRGKPFSVGDRIVMGGVRGDVVALDFTQTTILEMGEPPSVQEAAPPSWVHSRQYTGRLVTVSNAKIFDEPIYNYTRDFPYIWEELRVPIQYSANREKVERILLDAATRHTLRIRELGHEAVAELERRYVVKRAELEPRVYLRLTDNWVELTLRFLANAHGVRELKDRMTRDILPALEREAIPIASATFEVVGLPPLRVALDGVETAGHAAR